MESSFGDRGTGQTTEWIAHDKVVDRRDESSGSVLGPWSPILLVDDSRGVAT